MDNPYHLVRIVHLQGGLRAMDDRSGEVYVQVHPSKRFISFKAPAYSSLYHSLLSLGFKTLGVEFISEREFGGPDWWFAPPEGEFKLTLEGREWSNVRHKAYQINKADVADIARRCTALLELLGIRILQMSNAYNGTYVAAAARGNLPENNLFDNTYTPHIEAAIHSFLADAASLRDLLCEFVWTHVLHGEGEVRKFKSFRTKARDIGHPLAEEIICEGESGWIGHLSQLRNDVLHFAPIGAHYPFPACHARQVKLPHGEIVRYLSYGLVDREALKLDSSEALAIVEETQIIPQLQAFAAKLRESEDALEYAWRVLGELIALCGKRD